MSRGVEPKLGIEENRKQGQKGTLRPNKYIMISWTFKNMTNGTAVTEQEVHRGDSGGDRIALTVIVQVWGWKDI